MQRQYTARMNRIRSLFIAAACLLSLAAHAQWQWIDKDGRKVFSDRAPPPEIPLRSIVKQPGNTVRSSVASVPEGGASAPAAGASGAVSDPSAPKLSAVDKDLAEKKRLADAAAAAKVKAEEERIAKARSDNCARARSSKTLMESGVRVSITNAKGEREVIDDTVRTREVKRLQTVIDADCQ